MAAWTRKLQRLQHWTYDQKVVSLTPGRVAVRWSVPGWVTVCGQVTISVYNEPLRSTRPSVPSGQVYQVPAWLAGVKVGEGRLPVLHGM